MTTPQSHLQEAQKLTADAEVDLFTLSLVDQLTVFRFKNDETATWQGHVYDGIGCSMSGDKRSSSEEEGRPTLRAMNPAGMFQKIALDGLLDRAILVRKTVLRTHLDANLNIYRQRMWYVERVKELIAGEVIGLELRSMTDLPNFQLPARLYMPPEFPTVSL